MMRRICLIVAVIVATIGFYGCHPQTADTPPTTTTAEQLYPNWPALLGSFRFHWSFEPGIDATTGAAMLVRAYMESYDVAMFTLNIDNAYAGFLRATPENQAHEGNYLSQLIRIRPLGAGYTKTAKDAVPHFGFQAMHFLDIKQWGKGYRAVVCEGEYAHYLQSDVRPGKFVSVAVGQQTAQPYPANTGVSVNQIEFTQNDPRVGPNPPAPVTTPQRGPAPAPNQDVFGDWFITAASSNNWGPIDDPQSRDFPSPELQRKCSDRMPHNQAERMSMMTGFKDQPAPHGEAIPGWPMTNH